MKGLRRGAAALACVAALAGCSTLAGCSALAGKTSSDPTITSRPETESSAAASDASAQFDDGAVVSAVLAAARRDFETIYTYDYRDLGKYLNAGLAVSTTPYSSNYRKSFKGASAQLLRTRQQVQVPAADLAAVASIADGRKGATVVVHGSLTTSSSASVAPTQKNVSVVLELKLVGRTWRISTLTAGTIAKGTIPANAELRAAMSSAQTTLIRLFGLRRAQFDADFAKLLAGTTGDTHDQMTQQKAALKKVLVDGKYDLKSSIVGFAAVRASGVNAEFLVSVKEFRIGRQGAKFGPYPQTLDVSVRGVGGKWLVSNTSPVT